MGWFRASSAPADRERLDRQAAELVRRLEPGLVAAAAGAATLAPGAERRGYLWAMAAPVVAQAAGQQYPALRGPAREALVAQAIERLIEAMLARLSQDTRVGAPVRRAA